MKRILIWAFCLALCFGNVLTVFASEAEISRGCEYSLITPASRAYPDNMEKLTDGGYGSLTENSEGYYASPAYVGFERSDVDEKGNFVVIVDLGEISQDITSVSVGYLNERVYGIYAPRSIEFAISDTRNGEYNHLGILYSDIETESEIAGPMAKSLSLNNAKGRFLRVTITPDEYQNESGEKEIAKWTFIDEIAVFAHRNQNNLLNEGSQGDMGTPQTGDVKTRPIAYILLGISAVAMLVTLFVNIKPKKY